MMRAIAGRGGTEAIKTVRPVCLSVYDNDVALHAAQPFLFHQLACCCAACSLSIYLSLSISVRRLAKVKNIQQAPPAYPSIHHIRPEIDR
jgi:hypothetical protein